MESKKFSPSKGLMLSTLKRFWPMWLVVFIIWTLDYIIPLFIVSNNLEGLTNSMRGNSVLAGFITYEQPIEAFVFSAVVAVVVFSYMFKARSANFYASLPISRNKQFVTFFFAGLLPLLGVVVLVFLLTCLVSVGCDTMTITACLSWLGATAAYIVIFYCIAVLCIQIAGSVPAALMLYVVLNFIIPLLELALRALFSYLVVGVDAFDTLWFEDFSPLVAFMADVNFVAESGTIVLSGGRFLIIYLAVAVVAFVLSMMLYKHRKTEKVSTAIAFNWLKPVVKYLTGICAGLVLACFIVLCMISVEDTTYSGASMLGSVLLVIMVVVGTGLGVIFSEMILSKTTHVWKRIYIGLIVSCVFMGACMGFMIVEGNNVSNKVPEASEIESVTIEIDDPGSTTFTSQASIERAIGIHQEIVDGLNDGMFERAAKSGIIDYDSPWGSYSFYITYEYDNGRTLQRKYALPYYYDDEENFPEDNPSAVEASELAADIQDLLNTREGKKVRLQALIDSADKVYFAYWYPEGEFVSVEVYINDKNARAILAQAVAKDMAAGYVDMMMVDFTAAESSGYIGSIEFRFEPYEDYYTVYVSPLISPNTYKWMQENYS